MSHFLSNRFLLAMPFITDPYFARAVVYVCEHTDRGAIGIVVNQPLTINLAQIFEQMEIVLVDPAIGRLPVLCGGPVHPERGFVIHNPSGQWQSTLQTGNEICVTTSKDILKAIAQKQGPNHVIFSLGYANWGRGQLEQEIVDNFWLTFPADPQILFNVSFPYKWQSAMQQLGIDTTKLIYNSSGHA